MNSQEMKKLAESIFATHIELTEVFVCEDGNAFRTEREANKFAKTRGYKYERFERCNTAVCEELASNEEVVVEKATEKNKSDKQKK